MQIMDINLESLKSTKVSNFVEGINESNLKRLEEYCGKYEEKFKDLQEKLVKHINSSEEADKLEYFQWLKFPYLKEINESSIKLAAEVKAKGYKKAVIVGMGGSGINSLVLNNALAEFSKPRDKALELVVQNNLDSSSMQARLEQIGADLSETLFVIISKSGGTDEVRRNLYSIISYQKKNNPEKLKDLMTSLVFITEPAKEGKKNFLRELSAEIKEKFSIEVPFLENHPEVGGRFSMFSPVGMFSTELLGFDSKAMLAGAEECLNDFINEKSIKENTISKLALIDLSLNQSGIVDRYSMVYSDSLEAVNKFRAQLKGESLNKNGIDSTIHIPGIGTVNHHSDLELLLKDNNKVILEQIYFKNPVYEATNEAIDLENMKDLEGDSNHKSLIRNHIQPLRNYLIEKGAPIITTVIPEQDEKNLAYFLFQDMLVTIVQAGLQDEINSYEKLDLAIRQWEVERYKKSLKK